LLTHSEEFMLMGISSGVAILSLVVAYVMYIQRVNLPESDNG
jgi:NADH-quinone oxidoreductase subunit L